MADEISLSIELSVSKDGLDASKSTQCLIDQTAAGYVSRIQTIPTSDTVITLTGVTTPKVITIENIDATNYVKIGPTVAGAIAPLARLGPGQSMGFPIEPGAVLRALANAAAVDIAILVTET